MHEPKDEVPGSKFRTLQPSVFSLETVSPVAPFSHVSRFTRKGYDMRSHLLRLVLLMILATGFVLAKASGTVAALEPSPDTFMEQGLQAYQRGSFDQALVAWKQAADLYERDGKIGDQSLALAQAAQASESLGQISQAL